MPIRKKMEQDIIANGGLEIAVFDRVRNGESLNTISKTYGVSRSLLWRYLDKEPERMEEYKRSKLIGAAAQVEKAGDNLTEAIDYSKEHPNSAYIQAVRNDADFRKWHAGVTDRHTFGPPDKTVAVQVSIENLHLGALQAAGAPTQQIPEGRSVEVEADGPAVVKDKQPRLREGSTRAEPDSQSAIERTANQTDNEAS